MSFSDRALEALRDAGGRITVQRQLIVDVLSTSQEPMDAETLYQVSRQYDHTVSLATIYRTLTALESVGLVRPYYISSEHNHKYIELVKPDQYHFTCQRCHQIISFSSPLVAHLKEELERDLQVQVMTTCLCISGLCPDCKNMQSAKQGITNG